MMRASSPPRSRPVTCANWRGLAEARAEAGCTNAMSLFWRASRSTIARSISHQASRRRAPPDVNAYGGLLDTPSHKERHDMVINRVGPLSVAKIAGALYAIMGLIAGAVISLLAMAG